MPALRQSVPIASMNPFRHIDRDWFWSTFLVFLICVLLYYRVTFPKLRPTEPTESIPAKVKSHP